jgi:hypothetical protein
MYENNGEEPPEFLRRHTSDAGPGSLTLDEPDMMAQASRAVEAAIFITIVLGLAGAGTWASLG